MVVGSIKENTALEKREFLTLSSAKNIIGLGLKVCVKKVMHVTLELKTKNITILSDKSIIKRSIKFK